MPYDVVRFYFLVLIIIIFAGFSISNSFAQELSPPCIDKSQYEHVKYYWMFLSFFHISDWELRDLQLGCRGNPEAIFELPQYSSENSQYLVRFWYYNHAWHDIDENRHEVVAKSISRLNSTEIFQAINKNFDQKKVVLDYSWDGEEYYYITAYNESEKNDSYFEFGIEQDGSLFGDDYNWTGFDEKGELIESEKWGGMVEQNDVLTAFEFYVIVIISSALLGLMIWAIKTRRKSLKVNQD